MHIAVAAIARPTFDVDLAQATAKAAFDLLSEIDPDLIGSPKLLMDADSVAKAANSWTDAEIDGLVLIQATFADSTPAAALADTTDAPIVLWAFPEDRTGGRLRLNSLCGINLAGYVLRRRDTDYRWVFRHPSDLMARSKLEIALGTSQPQRNPNHVDVTASDLVSQRAANVRRKLAQSRVGIIGDRPTGFEPCAYNPADLHKSTGVTATAVALPRLFDRATAAADSRVDDLKIKVSSDLTGIADLDQSSLSQSLRLHLGLRDLVEEEKWDAIATRCWPECFTEFGAAACTPQSMLTEAGVPACCEADAYGAVTGLILQWLVDAPTFIADLVDLDRSDNTAVFWHCGLAPMSLADPDSVPSAALHSNRHKPLLNEFPLKPGRFTLARLSQSAGTQRIVVGGGEMVKAPLAFSGTAGVARLDRPVDDTLSTVMSEGLEHHYGIAYGDVRPELRALADQLGLAVVEI